LQIASITKFFGAREMAEEERYKAAWRDRRLRMIVFKSVQIGFFPLLVGMALFTPRSNSRDIIVFIVVGWFLAYIVAGIWLNRFRCPRCGKFYYWDLRWRTSIERRKTGNWRPCHHCGLAQDAMP
jgi:hypothetical protein